MSQAGSPLAMCFLNPPARSFSVNGRGAAWLRRFPAITELMFPIWIFYPYLSRRRRLQRGFLPITFSARAVVGKRP